MHKNFTLPVHSCFLFLFIICSPGVAIHVKAQAPSLTFQPLIEMGLNTPVDIVNAGDGTNRLFIVSQKAATISVYDATYNFLGTLLAVSGVGTAGPEEGLLSMAFHPDYETNGFFFVYYTNTTGDIELARYQVSSADPNIADPGSKAIVLTIPHPVNNNHYGAKLNFGHDGNLYFATGDGGGQGDPANNAQNGNLLLGKMLRINVSTGATGPIYTIPPGNPYISDPNIRDEIWAMGLRNPFRWSFDRATGDMWIGDVGEGGWEEINFVAGPTENTGGKNYGWRCFEGNHPFASCTPGAGTITAPVFEYPNLNVSGSPAAVTGGIVYRGTEFPSLAGYYVASDFYSGNTYLIKNNGSGGWITTIQTGTPTWIAAFGESEGGATLYALSLTGTLYKVNAAAQAPTPVELTSFTGKRRGNIIQLDWGTQNEIDVKHYEVEFSSNGTDFKQIGIVPANNSSNYQFNHTLTVSTKLYYRLRILDIDGQFEYSKIIQVNPGAIQGDKFVRPSIITNKVLNLHLSEPFSHVQLISIEGKEVWKHNISGSTGAISHSLPNLLPGSYLVRLISKEKILTQKITIR